MTKNNCCKMILSKSQEGTGSCSLIGFVGKKLFRIKVIHKPKGPLALYRVKDCKLKYEKWSIMKYNFSLWRTIDG